MTKKFAVKSPIAACAAAAALFAAFSCAASAASAVQAPAAVIEAPASAAATPMSAAIAAAEAEYAGAKAVNASLRPCPTYGLVWDVRLVGENGARIRALVDAEKGGIVAADLMGIRGRSCSAGMPADCPMRNGDAPRRSRHHGGGHHGFWR